MVQSKQTFYSFSLFTQPRNFKQRFLFLLILGLIFILLLLDCSFVRYRLLNESPAPTFWAGQKVVTWRWAYLLTNPHKNDLVIYSRDNSIYHVGKIIAIPGDQVATFNGNIYVDGAPQVLRDTSPNLSRQATSSIPDNYVGVLVYKVRTGENKFELIPVRTLQGEIIGHWQVLLI